MTFISAFQRQSQADFCEFRANLIYVLGKPGLQSQTQSQNNGTSKRHKILAPPPHLSTPSTLDPPSAFHFTPETLALKPLLPRPSKHSFHYLPRPCKTFALISLCTQLSSHPSLFELLDLLWSPGPLFTVCHLDFPKSP